MKRQPPVLQAKDPAENRAVFVDEFECIGCKQCVWCASATFRCAVSLHSPAFSSFFQQHVGTGAVCKHFLPMYC